MATEQPATLKAAQRPNTETAVSVHECRAMRHLAADDYGTSVLAFMFETKSTTVSRHVGRDCQHVAIHETGNPRERWTERALLTAYRVVYEQQPYERMSQAVYDEYRPDEFPSGGAITKRLGSWTAARDRARGVSADG
jgi:hypothetical protein